MRRALGPSRNAYYDEVHRARQENRFGELYKSLVVDDEALERGLQDGSLVMDTRLRDALHALRKDGEREFALPASDESPLVFPRPSVVDDAAYAVDVAALGEADVVRVQRQLDTLEGRLSAMESRPAARLYTKLGRVAKRTLRR